MQANAALHVCDNVRQFPVPKPKTDYLSQLKGYHDLIRLAGELLTTPEFRIVLAIYDQTVGLGPSFHSRPMQRSILCEGLTNDEGDLVFAGVAMSDRQLRTHLNSLENKGFIRREHREKGGMTVYTIIHDWKTDMLAKPKRLQGKQAEEHDGGWRKSAMGSSGNSPGVDGGNSPHIKQDTKNQDRDNQDTSSVHSASLRSGAGVSASLRPSQPLSNFDENEGWDVPGKPSTPASRSTPQEPSSELFENLAPLVDPKAKRAEADHRTSIKPSAINKTFRLAFADAHGHIPGVACPASTKEDLGRLKAVVCNKWDRDPESLHALVDWFVREWPTIKATSFKKLKVAPALPAMWFFCRFFPDIAFAWGGRAKLEWRNSLTNAEQKAYESLRAEGKTHDEASFVLA